MTNSMTADCDEQDKAAPATDTGNETSSATPEPADFYRRLGGW